MKGVRTINVWSALVQGGGGEGMDAYMGRKGFTDIHTDPTWYLSDRAI